MKNIFLWAVIALIGASALSSCSQVTKKNDQARPGNENQNRNLSSDDDGCGTKNTIDPNDLVGKELRYGSLMNILPEKDIVARVAFSDAKAEIASVSLPLVRKASMGANLDLSNYPAKGSVDAQGFFVLKDLASVNAMISWLKANYCRKSTTMTISSRMHLKESEIKPDSADSQLGTFIESYVNSFRNSVGQLLTKDGSSLAAPVTNININYTTAHAQQVMCLSQGSFGISCE